MVTKRCQNRGDFNIKHCNYECYAIFVVKGGVLRAVFDVGETPTEVEHELP